MNKIIIALILLLSVSTINAQNQQEPQSNHSFDIGAGLVSRYVWRGLLFSGAANIQPWATYSYKNFSLGTTGSYATSGNYAEVDLFVSYVAGAFSFTICDYYAQDESGFNTNNYFNFKNNETQHYLEATVTYTVSEKFPLTATLATFFYGADYDPVANKNNLSTYTELAYPFQFANIDINVFCGATINEGYYATKAGIVNLGFTAQKSIPLSDKYSLPLSTSFVLNPTNNEIFLVFGIHI